ncbi:MAG: hypothetical protein R3Y09_10590 [Clostridia bacterium]
MHLSALADQYLDTIHSLNRHLDGLNNSLSTTKSLETKRKIRDKIVAHETVLRQTTKTYHHLKKYYDKNETTKSWI